MRRQEKDSKPVNRDNGKVKEEPLTDNMESPVRKLIFGGAFIDARVSDAEYINILNKGKVGNGWKITGHVRPKAIGTLDVEEFGVVRISIEIGSKILSRPASAVLMSAGVSDDFVKKVRELEKKIESGDYFDDPGPALGGIEGAFIEEKKKNSK